MTQEKYDTFRESIPAYVLGALGWDEASALKDHLETCEVCQAELVRYKQISDGLLAALPPRAPSPAIRRKLFARLNEKKRPVLWQALGAFRQIAVGAVALILLIANLFAFTQIRDLRQQQTQLAGQIEKSQTILGMLAASTEIHPISGDGFSGNLLLDREKNLSFLLAWNLPPPPNDQVYQIWLVSPDGERVGAGLFRPEVDRPFTSTALITSHNFAEFVGIEVTIEPEGGSDMPTGEKILNTDY